MTIDLATEAVRQDYSAVWVLAQELVAVVSLIVAAYAVVRRWK